MAVRSLGITLLLIIGVFVFGALVMNFVVMPLIVHQRASVIVPDVRGMSEQQATKTLERYELTIRIERSEHSSEVPDGYVVGQRPRPNDTVKQGRSVAVVVSLGAKTQRVPDLKDLSLRQGRLLLTRQKLHAGRVSKVLREGGSRESVLAFAPGAGTEVREGTEIDLLVGVGGRPKRYLMPDLNGQDLFFVKEKLEGLGFRVGNIRYEKEAGNYPNTIIDQFPKPGVMIREGDSIELVAAGSG